MDRRISRAVFSEEISPNATVPFGGHEERNPDSLTSKGHAILPGWNRSGVEARFQLELRVLAYVEPVLSVSGIRDFALKSDADCVTESRSRSRVHTLRRLSLHRSGAHKKPRPGVGLVVRYPAAASVDDGYPQPPDDFRDRPGCGYRLPGGIPGTLGVRVVDEMVYTEWIEEVLTVEHLGSIKGKRSFLLKPIELGTYLHWREELHMPLGWLGDLVFRLMFRSALRRTFTQDLRSLKAQVEGRHDVGNPAP